MGVLRDFSEVYRLALDKINAEANDIGVAGQDSFLPLNKAIDVLTLNIATEMERFVWAFAIKRILLTNEINDRTRTTDREGNKVNRLYTLPRDLSYIVGVYNETNLPYLELILSNYKEASNSSLIYSKNGASDISVSTADGERNEPIWLIYISNSPPIAEMTSAFQTYLVSDLATHLYIGRQAAKNSNIYRELKREKAVSYSSAMTNQIENTRDFKKVYPDIIDVAYIADKEGQLNSIRTGREYDRVASEVRRFP